MRLDVTARVILDAFIISIDEHAISCDNRLSCLLRSEVMTLLEASEAEFTDLILEIQNTDGYNVHV